VETDPRNVLFLLII